MAIKINWSIEADKTFSQNFNYLRAEWSDKEAEKFVQQTEQVLKRVQLFPESYPETKAKNIVRQG